MLLLDFYLFFISVSLFSMFFFYLLLCEAVPRWFVSSLKEIVFNEMKNFKFNKILLKEYSGQCSVLIQIHIVTRNEKLCKIYFKKLFFQNVLASIDLFYRYHYIHYFIYSDCM